MLVKVSFTGRLAGAIGITYKHYCTVEVDSIDLDAISLQLYKGDINGQAYDHIMLLKVEGVL